MFRAGCCAAYCHCHFIQLQAAATACVLLLPTSHCRAGRCHSPPVVAHALVRSAPAPAFGTLGAIRTLHPLRAVDALGTVDAIRAVGPLGPREAIAAATIRPGGTILATDISGRTLCRTIFPTDVSGRTLCRTIFPTDVSGRALCRTVFLTDVSGGALCCAVGAAVFAANAVVLGVIPA